MDFTLYKSKRYLINKVSILWYVGIVFVYLISKTYAEGGAKDVLPVYLTILAVTLLLSVVAFMAGRKEAVVELIDGKLLIHKPLSPKIFCIAISNIESIVYQDSGDFNVSLKTGDYFELCNDYCMSKDDIKRLTDLV
mgnify:CR=1 FL=1